jgi:hypothetical protein
LLIFTDDQGYGDVSTYHESDVRTPNIDRLAAEGMLFTTMRANCTVCSPSRAALLTGRYADRVGVPGVIRTRPETRGDSFDPSVPTLADELKKAGYHTAIVGKWHLGLESPNTPNERGFDFFHGFLGDMMDSYTTHLRHGNNYLRRNGETIEAEGHATDLFTAWAGAYLRERAKHPGQPFFLYLAYNAPHFPHRAARGMAGEGQAAGASVGRQAGEERRLRRAPGRRHRPCAGGAPGSGPGPKHAGRLHRRQRRLAAARAEQRSLAGRQAEPLRRRPARAVHGPLAGPHPGRLAQRLRGAELRPVPHASWNWPAPRPPRKSTRRACTGAERRYDHGAARSVLRPPRRRPGLRRQELRGDHPRRVEAAAKRSVQPAGTVQSPE